MKEYGSLDDIRKEVRRTWSGSLHMNMLEIIFQQARKSEIVTFSACRAEHAALLPEEKIATTALGLHPDYRDHDKQSDLALVWFSCEVTAVLTMCWSFIAEDGQKFDLTSEHISYGLQSTQPECWPQGKRPEDWMRNTYIHFTVRPNIRKLVLTELSSENEEPIEESESAALSAGERT